MTILILIIIIDKIELWWTQRQTTKVKTGTKNNVCVISCTLIATICACQHYSCMHVHVDVQVDVHVVAHANPVMQNVYSMLWIKAQTCTYAYQLRQYTWYSTCTCTCAVKLEYQKV